jgi:ATP-dependent helicase/nuclease subunit B
MIFTKSSRGSINLRIETDTLVQQGRTEELLLIVPTNRKSRYLKREIISASPGKSAAEINIETLGTFAQKMISENETSSGKMLSDAAAAVLLKQSFQENKLRYFSKYADDVPAGTIERIRNVLSEYKRHGITPDLLREESDILRGTEKIKVEDIADIYDSYNKLCSSLGVKEIGDVYAGLNKLSQEVITKTFADLYPNVKLILIDGFDEFTTPEIDLINSLSEIKTAELFVEFDYYGLNENIFVHLEKCYRKLLNKGFRPYEADEINTPGKFRKLIREKLFTSAKEKSEEFNIHKIEAPSREKEVEFIAKEIKGLLRSGNVQPGEICVVFNLIKKYSPFIRDIFPVYGLPFNLTDRNPLSLSSPVTGIINFLEILENDYYYRNVFRALSAGYIKPGNVNLSNLYKASVGLKIISGYNHWISSLQDAIAVEIKEKEGGGRSSRLLIYEKALQDIRELHTILHKFDKKMSVREFRELLVQTLFDINIHSEIVNNKSDNVEENIKGLTEFINTIDELFELLELEEKNNKLPLGYFLNNIRTAVSGARFNVKEKPGYGVQITNLNEIRGLSFNYLFIGGLCDGDLPTRYTPEIFYSGTYSKNEKIHQTGERYHFYQALCSWRKELYLSYPLHDDNKELARSTLLTEVEQLLTLKNKNTGEYNYKIYSKEEMLQYAGKNGSRAAELTSGNSFFDHDIISRSVNISKLRMNDPFGSSEYTGSIIEKLNELSKQSLKEFCSKEFSITQLESYASCPFRYFADRVLRLAALEEPSEEIEAKEFGSLLHIILYKFYSKLNEQNITLKNADEACFNSAVKLIFDIAAEEVSSASFSPLSFYEKEKILGIKGRREDSILYRFLVNERNSDDNFIPAFFEVSFGDLPAEKMDKGEILPHFKVGNVKVRGKIDRIDIDDSAGKFKVIDYKSGAKRPTETDISEGLSIQLPLYMIAARELLKLRLKKDYDAASAEIFTLKYHSEKFKKFPVVKINKKTDEENIKLYEDTVERCVSAIESYVESIAGGKFNLSQLKDRENRVCRFCSYRTVCRIDDVN